ncbi:M57 family metalloprotease [Flavobacterium sp. 1355]|uniref:M57 family metalloprotease n=1 Tax=Flavobacterium sp. 1355 TaxID=2806571 RepID=UPI001AE3EC12|nr:M57 family metalloprotease [Flavobacterium sp. 1355]MBP1221554.1 putative Zn-dependent protease [Flavobacterium sp. 1355]
MKKTKKMRKIWGIITLCFSPIFIQCSNDDNKVVEQKVMTEQEINEIIHLRNFLSKSLEMDFKKIICDSNKNAFIIDGDIKMSFEDARDHFNYSKSKMTSKINQRADLFQMTTEIAGNVKIYIAPEVTAEWRTAINQAIIHWNNINSSIHVSIIDSPTSSSINITVIKEGAGNLAYATLPQYNRLPGRSIQINSYYNNSEAYKKLCTMTHELGHTFGFRHTNENIGPQIPCTPLYDEGSVMQIPVHEWNKFNYYDNIAISSLYPVAAGTKKLYRFRQYHNGLYFYSTDACEITPDKGGYVFDGEAGYLFSTQVPGTVPLYRSNLGIGVATLGHKLSTSRISSKDILLGYLYSAKQSGTTALYCIKNFGKQDMYSTQKEGSNPLIYGYVLHNLLSNE